MGVFRFPDNAKRHSAALFRLQSGPAVKSGHNMSQQLNFLVIISGEHRKDAMGCAGHPIVKTPNPDALAARGTMLTSAYTPSPCACRHGRRLRATCDPEEVNARAYAGQRRRIAAVVLADDPAFP